MLRLMATQLRACSDQRPGYTAAAQETAVSKGRHARRKVESKGPLDNPVTETLALRKCLY
jgi:hypothetical protein